METRGRTIDEIDAELSWGAVKLPMGRQWLVLRNHEEVATAAITLPGDVQGSLCRQLSPRRRMTHHRQARCPSA